MEGGRLNGHRLKVMKAAAVQIAVGVSLEDNLDRAATLIDEAVAQGARFIALPECFTGKYGVSLFASHRERVPCAAAEGEPPRTGAALLAQRAKQHGVFITGGVIEEDEDGTLYNSMPTFGPDGSLISTYRKVHLSRVMGITSESDVLTPGDQTVTIDVGMTVGMACCFDLRFPTFLAQYGPRVAHPAHIICAPSAFLDLTGKEHWDLLIRRTALDGQCFVVAPDIAFDPSDATPLHGRTAIVDPFGKILAQCAPEGDGLAVAEVSCERVEEVRKNLPLTLWAQ